MKRVLALLVLGVLGLVGLTACMGDDDGDSAQAQRRTGAIGAAGAVGHDYQLTIDGVTAPGEAIQVVSFSAGAESATTIGSATGGATVGKVKFNEFKFMKSVDKASPKLYEKLATGLHAKNAVLTLQKSTSGKPVPYMIVTLETVFVSKVDYAGSNPEVPMEQVALVYGTMKTEYKGQSATGVAEAPVSFGWNQMTNTKAP